MTVGFRRPLIFLLFFGSGAVGLIYEVCWVRLLTLHFGSTFPAVSTVLTVFMGGLAAGAWIGGRWADRIARPLAVYGALELALAVYAALTPLLFDRVMPLFEGLGFGVWEVAMARFAASALLLALPTGLMGATLPILARFVASSGSEAGRGAGLLYGVNTIGGFVGTTGAGLLLLPSLGMQATLWGAAGLNVLLGAAAWAAGRRPSAPVPAGPAPLEPEGPVWPVGLAVALTGFSALTCEVVWTRVLSLVLPGSVYAFSVMLATFLAGLGIGAAITAGILSGNQTSARRVFVLLALGSALSVSMMSHFFARLPETFRHLYFKMDLPAHPELVLNVQFFLASGLMLAPALLMGGLFPAALRIVVRDPARAGRRVGVLYAWNTAGTILGSFAAGFILIPRLGIRNTVVLAAAVQCMAAVLASASGRQIGSVAVASVAAMATLTVVGTVTPAWHPQLMSSGMGFYASYYEKPGLKGLEGDISKNEKMLYYRDGLAATVTVVRELSSSNYQLLIATNGKIDGSSRSDLPTQRLSAHLPLLLHPDPRHVCVIGMGTGCTAGSATLYPQVESVTVAEIEEGMVEGSKLFAEVNHDVHQNPRARIQVTDGRLWLRLNPGAYDVVISEPSSCWLAGASDLFTREFWRLGARSLKPKGIFLQWVQLYGMNPKNFSAVVRTFQDVFPHTFACTTIIGSDVLLVGSREPLELDFERVAARMRIPAVKEDLEAPEVAVYTAADLAARIRLGPAEARVLAGAGPLNTDDWPFVAYTAPRDQYRDDQTRTQNEELIASVSRGVGPYVLRGTVEERRRFLAALVSAYRMYLGPQDRHEEAEATEALLKELEGSR